MIFRHILILSQFHLPKTTLTLARVTTIGNYFFHISIYMSKTMEKNFPI